jgi:Uma2 family endonuclease
MNTARKEDAKYYTYDDYITWGDDVRYELVFGEPRALAAPLVRHQVILGELHLQLGNYLKGKSCKVFVSPIDVRIFIDDDDTIYQPDLIVVCDKSKIIDGKSFKGAPEIVIEILSPSTALIDKLEKYHNYLKAGVQEYWIVDPDIKTINVFILEDGRYFSYVYGEKDVLRSQVLKDIKVDLAEVFIDY